MDDAVRPPGAPETDSEAEPGNASDGTVRHEKPLDEYAPAARDETAPRLELDRDPFAPPPPAYPAPDPEPLIPAIEATNGTASESFAETESDPPAAAEGDSPELADGGPAVSQEELSLDDMVGELGSGELGSGEPTGAAEPASDEAGPDEPASDEVALGEAESDEQGGDAAGTVVATGVDEAEEMSEPASWRDAVDSGPAVVAEPVLARRQLSTRLPFWIYGGSWAVFVGTLTYLMWPLSEEPFVESSYYMYLVLGGAGMTVLGLVLGVATWAIGRAGTVRAEREGLVRAVMLRTMGWTAIGVVLWWACLYALDLHRTGIIG